MSEFFEKAIKEILEILLGEAVESIIPANLLFFLLIVCFGLACLYWAIKGYTSTIYIAGALRTSKYYMFLTGIGRVISVIGYIIGMLISFGVSLIALNHELFFLLFPFNILFVISFELLGALLTKTRPRYINGKNITELHSIIADIERSMEEQR